MGILDSKKRIFDTIITQEGRRQLGLGEFNIQFVAFSDKFTFYEKDVVSGSSDASERIYIEAASLPQDMITFESDDRGRLISFEKEGTIGVINGKIVSGSSSVNKAIVTDQSAFSSLAGILISGSAENFSKLRILGTKDKFLDNNNFVISNNLVEFQITNDVPILEEDVQAISVDDIESLFQDKRLSHLPNFMFLPPINKPNVLEPNGSQLGKFVPLEQNDYRDNDYKDKRTILLNKNKDFKNGVKNDYNVLLKSLRGKHFETIEFTETSRSNNLFSQFFEIREKEILKLDAIDFGSFPSRDPAKPDPHVFFVGKIFIDSVGRHTFTNIFTLIFE